MLISMGEAVVAFIIKGAGCSPLSLSKRWQQQQPRLLFVMLLFCLASCGLVASATTTTTATAVDAIKTERPLLLYIPMHVSEPLEHLQELCDRTLLQGPLEAG